MQVDQVAALLRDALPNSEIEVNNDGNHYFVTAISEAFDGVSRVKRQQMIYAVLNEHVLSGTIHALHIKTFSPSEWQAQA
ncbi:MAG TPA: BolA family protein [Pseudomonadales bacterium]|nr:BolA family protein [Pseudomonadales bacterium]